MWQIIINGPGYFDTTYELPEGVTHLGRADENDIVLGGDLVSRRHARLVVNGNSLRVEDLGSRNGSRVNGEPLHGAQELSPGDSVALGENTLSVRRPHRGEALATEMVDVGGTQVRRFGVGDDVGPSVLLARNVRDVDVLKALDNFRPPSADTPAAPVAPVPAGVQRVAYETLVLLFHTAEALSTAGSLATFLEATMDRLLAHTLATTAVVLLRQPAGTLMPAAVRHQGRLARGEVPVSDAIVETALRQGHALAVAAARDDRRFSARESVILYGVDRVLCIPIGTEPPFSGVLYVNTSTRVDTTLAVMLDACTAVAHLVATGLQKFAREEGARTEGLRHTLERFLPPGLAARQAAEAHAGPRLGLEERQLTVLHAELPGLGALALRLGSEQAHALLDTFYTHLGNLIFSFEGAVEGFFGEALRAYFGAPQARPDDAVRAVRAALALRADWERVMLARPVEERCALRVGLHTGKALAGLVGPESRPSFTALGEPAPLAALLAASAGPSQVLITARTLAAIGSRFDVAPLGERVLRGKERVATFEVLEEDAAQLTHPGTR
jgi:adenylate cyclase